MTNLLADDEALAQGVTGARDSASLATPDERARIAALGALRLAVLRLYPQAEFAGAVFDEYGFHADFAGTPNLTPDDLKSLDSEMRLIVKSAHSFAVAEPGEVIPSIVGPHYERELIKESVQQGKVSPVLVIRDKSGDVSALPLHNEEGVGGLPNPRYFELVAASSAYWRGQEDDASLQRIQAAVFAGAEGLRDYRSFLEEASRRDHRRLGSEMELFALAEEVGPGLPIFLPNGAIVRDTMERYSWDRHRDAGYSLIRTPFIAKEGLFLRSGHLPYYADSMFPPMNADGEDYYLKAMNCPMHAVVFSQRGRSYRELPLRLFEFGSVHRFERSGTLHGLTRVRNMTQDDAHIFCTQEMIQQELTTVLAFVLDLLRDFGLDDFYLELSTRGDSKKFIGSDEQWARATDALRFAAESTGLSLVPDPGGAAFYGPKISVQIRDSLGRSWQVSTIQLDFQTPERFNLSYRGESGRDERPVMIHRALFGSIERFLGILTEHYAGNFPSWMAPVQVTAMTVKNDDESGQVQYLDELCAELAKHGVRVDVDTSSERLAKKIKLAHRFRAPFTLIVGDKDVAGQTAAIRFRNGDQLADIPREKVIAAIVALVSRRGASSASDDSASASFGEWSQ